MILPALLASLLLSLTSFAQEQEEAKPALDLSGETVVVYNPDFSQSRDLAEYYAEKRGIPKDRLIGLDLPLEDSISREQYEKLIRKPLFETFVRRGWWKLALSEITDPSSSKPRQAMLVGESGVRVVCLMRGVPFQIRREQEKPATAKEDEASVDSELATLGMPSAALAGAIRNPYFDQDVRFQIFQGAPGMLIVGRLDAPDADTVKRMIDDALHAEQEGLRGRAVIDLALKSGAYQEGEDWLARSTILFREHGVPVFIDKEESLIPDHWPLPDTAFYFGWYAATVGGAVGSPSFKFMPGAIACHLHSYSAAAIRSEDRHWVGPLLKHGAAVSLGNVFEPYLSLTVHFDVLNQRLMEGYTVGEAAWNATPVLSWMNVLCGDPLYRPYARGPGSTMGDDGRGRDYALYQGIAMKYQERGSQELKQALSELAETRNKPHLLELTALLSASEGKNGEAIDLLEHAESLYVINADKVRTLLYLTELYRKEGRTEQSKKLLQKILADPAFANVPAILAAKAMLEKQ
ncbi:MAG: TIGR03790 family protein [Verrucomicrobiota bacterium]